MNSQTLDRVLRCPSLPTLPAVAVRVLELTQNPGVSLDELARAIEHDQGLAAKVLRTVNSSFYGLRRPCSNINQALVMLGLSTVKALALSFSLVTSVNESVGRGFDLVSYWRRGLYTAVAAKCIARQAGVLAEDEAFLGGLLQDIGVMALYQALGDEYLSILHSAQGDHARLAALELATFELQHPEVGAMLAQRWRLPAELIVPIRYHERPTAAPSEQTDLVRCVGLGNLAHDVLTDADPGPALARFRARVHEWFALDGAVADDLIRKIAEGTRALSGLFRLDTGRFADTDAVMARAQAQLAEVGDDSAEGAAMQGLLSDSHKHDPLTGVLTREAMGPAATERFQKARAAGKGVGAVEIVVERLAEIDAAGGPESVDAVMVEVAAVIETLFAHRGAVIGRWGGTGFMVVAPGMDGAAAIRAASDVRARLAVQSPAWGIKGLAGPVMVSVGAAGWDKTWVSVEQAFEAAERARGMARKLAA